MVALLKEFDYEDLLFNLGPYEMAVYQIEIFQKVTGRIRTK